MKTQEECTERLRLRTFGVVMELRTNAKELLPRMVRHLPPDWDETTAKPEVIFSLIRLRQREDRYQLFRGEQRMGRSSRLSRVLADFESDVQLYVAEMSPRRVFVHAGVIGWRGAAIMIPGRSFSGKTTLVRELVRAGASYYSDEYAVLDDHGRVHPYARALAVRRKGRLNPQRVRAESIGAEVGEKPLPVRLIVLCQYREGGKWRPRTLSTGAGALEVLTNTVPARRRPQKVVAVIGQVVSGAAIIKTTRGEVREAARLILEYLDRLSVPPRLRVSALKNP
ncbi:MAG: hypothetical protein ABI882_13200 [Acidobacteriota bacterium]